MEMSVASQHHLPPHEMIYNEKNPTPTNDKNDTEPN